MNPKSVILGAVIKRFMGDYLPQQRAFSEHTILSYRDSLKLLLQFVAGKKRRVSEVAVTDLNAPTILAFLNHLENTRGNSSATRNVRLSAIHSFFDYLSSQCPEHMELSQRVLNIAFKRTTNRVVEYVEADELQAILASIDRSTAMGRRDSVLLSLMFNTGARIHEIVSLKINDLRLHTSPSVKFLGKGRKERICPLWPETARLLKQYINEPAQRLPEDGPIFLNNRGSALTRFGARLILQRHVKKAAQNVPTLRRKQIHPHSLRHSTAVHLLRSGVDLSTIAHWLGHTSVNTTYKYVTVDLEAKRCAIAKAKPIVGKFGQASRWKENEDLLKWLESL